MKLLVVMASLFIIAQSEAKPKKPSEMTASEVVNTWVGYEPHDRYVRNLKKDYAALPKTISVQMLVKDYEYGDAFPAKKIKYENKNEVLKTHPLLGMCRFYTYDTPMYSPYTLEFWDYNAYDSHVTGAFAYEILFDLKDISKISKSDLKNDTFLEAANCIIEKYSQAYDTEMFDYLKKYYPQWVKNYNVEQRAKVKSQLLEQLKKMALESIASDDEESFLSGAYLLENLKIFTSDISQSKKAINERLAQIANDGKLTKYLVNYILVNKVFSEKILSAVMKFEQINTEFKQDKKSKRFSTLFSSQREQMIFFYLIEQSSSYSEDYRTQLDSFILSKFEQTQVFEESASAALESTHRDGHYILGYLLNRGTLFTKNERRLKILGDAMARLEPLSVGEDKNYLYRDAGYGNYALLFLNSNFATTEPFRSSILKSYTRLNEELLCVRRDTQGYKFGAEYLPPLFSVQVAKFKSSLINSDLVSASNSLIDASFSCPIKDKESQNTFPHLAVFDIFADLLSEDKNFATLIDESLKAVLNVKNDYDRELSAIHYCRIQNHSEMISDILKLNSSPKNISLLRLKILQRIDILNKDNDRNAYKDLVFLLKTYNEFVDQDSEVAEKLVSLVEHFVKSQRQDGYPILAMHLVRMLANKLDSNQIQRIVLVGMPLFSPEEAYLYFLKLALDSETYHKELDSYFSSMSGSIRYEQQSLSIYYQFYLGWFEKNCSLEVNDWAKSGNWVSNYQDGLSRAKALGYHINTEFKTWDQ